MSQLRSFIERIETVEGEIKSLNDDKRDIYAEAKGAGYDAKVIKRVVAERRKDPSQRDEADAIFDLYWAEVHGTGTAPATRVQAHDGEVDA